MSNLIKLLPDHISNQIAAGEVVQRPASAVKELMENSIDAGCTKVQVIIKEAGKKLIQVIDNGCGMSLSDARMSFERHATSKISAADDLMMIRTMGFRGEAMASIAAVAQVEMKTRTHDTDLGTCLHVENSKVISQEPCQCPAGTNIMIKNLFFNVPARRNFLKSVTVEFKHILDEFTRVAMAFPDIHFSLYHNDKEIYVLPPSNLRQRITHIFGSQANMKLVPLEEKTETVNIYGFIGKPEYAKKTRGEQYFFVNNRFIKSNYLNHAVASAYQGLLQAETFPLYVIFLEMDPKRLDINIHPTKQEIRFENENIVYNYLRVATRHALGQFNAGSSIDFDQEGPFSDNERSGSRAKEIREKITYAASSNGPYKESIDIRQSSNLRNWQRLFDGLEPQPVEILQKEEENFAHITSQPGDRDVHNGENHQPLLFNSKRDTARPIMQIHKKFVICQTKAGLMILNLPYARQRILFEELLKNLDRSVMPVQKELYPKTIQLKPSETELLEEVLPLLKSMGFDISGFGKDTYVIQGVPSGLGETAVPEEILLSFLEHFKNNTFYEEDARKRVAEAFSQASTRHQEKDLSMAEMENIIGRLFSCETPSVNPRGKKCFITLTHNELNGMF